MTMSGENIPIIQTKYSLSTLGLCPCFTIWEQSPFCFQNSLSSPVKQSFIRTLSLWTPHLGWSGTMPGVCDQGRTWKDRQNKKCFIKRFAYTCGNSKERRRRRWHIYLCPHISCFTNANTELLWGSKHLEQQSHLGSHKQPRLIFRFMQRLREKNKAALIRDRN